MVLWLFFTVFRSRLATALRSISLIVYWVNPQSADGGFLSPWSRLPSQCSSQTTSWQVLLDDAWQSITVYHQCCRNELRKEPGEVVTLDGSLCVGSTVVKKMEKGAPCRYWHRTVKFWALTFTRWKHINITWQIYFFAYNFEYVSLTLVYLSFAL